MPKRAVAPAGVSGVSWAIKASRSASTSLICASSNSRRSSSLQISAFRCFDSARPSPVRSASRRWRRSRFTGSYPRIPCVKSPFMRLTWKTRSAIRVFRSRPIRRLSSSSGVRASRGGAVCSITECNAPEDVHMVRPVSDNLWRNTKRVFPVHSSKHEFDHSVGWRLKYLAELFVKA